MSGKYEPANGLGRLVHDSRKPPSPCMLGLMTADHLRQRGPALRLQRLADLGARGDAQPVRLAGDLRHVLRGQDHRPSRASMRSPTFCPLAAAGSLALVAAACCLIYAVLLMKGAWDYWAPFARVRTDRRALVPRGLHRDPRPGLVRDRPDADARLAALPRGRCSTRASPTKSCPGSSPMRSCPSAARCCCSA